MNPASQQSSINNHQSLRIGIDSRFVGPQGTGLGKYTEKLIENLRKIDNKNEYVIFLKKENFDFFNFPKESNFSKVVADIPWYSVEEQLRLPKILKAQKLDLLHVPHFNAPIFYRGKFIVTIHDLIHHSFKESAATTKNPVIFRLKRFAYRKVIKNTIEKSQKIIVPSNFTKKEILDSFNVDESKIIRIYEAAEEEYFNNQQSTINNQQLLKKYQIKKPFLIYVGNAYPHKNLEKLLKAHKLLTTNYKLPTNLVIVSARDVFTQRLNSKIKELELENRVTLTGYVESDDLPRIFSEAEAYVFPTLSEGFGIPALNAMAAGLPVACSNIPTLKEVYEDAAIYFDPASEADIAQKIKKVLENKKLRDDMAKRGFKQSQKYSWRKMAEKTLKVYESAT